MSRRKIHLIFLTFVYYLVQVILFIFDLSRRGTLTSVKEWYRQARGLNRVSTTTHTMSSQHTRIPCPRGGI